MAPFTRGETLTMRIGGQATVTGTTATKGVPWVHILAHKQDKMQLGTAEGFVSVSVSLFLSVFLLKHNLTLAQASLKLIAILLPQSSKC